MTASWRVITCIAFVTLTSCTGEIGAGPSSPPGALPPSEPAASQGPGGPTSESGNGAGITPLRRLTRLELDNTLRDLLGDASEPALQLFPADARGPNRFTTGGVVSTAEARAYYEAAKAVAASAITRLASFFSCDSAALGEPACADRFIRDFGKRAYRRPVSEEEAADLRALYEWARAQPGYTFTDGVRVVLQAMLQSPHFIYHEEVATRPTAQDKLVHLTPHEVASRLSYFFWSSMPDDTLLAEADAGRLATAAELESQARRLLADPKTSATLASFHHDWLLLDQLDITEKDLGRFPAFTGQARAAMQAETTAFVGDVFANDGHLSALLTANHSFIDASLAPIYGLPAPSMPGLSRVELDPTQGRSGILTQLSVLANAATPYSTSPVRRGKLVREQLLCQDLPPPDPNVNTTPPTPAANVPGRQQWAQHSSDPACSGCHTLMDPIGFAFENFDAIGAFRSSDGGAVVDASGAISGSAASDGSFNGVRELAQHLLASPDVHACVVKQWFRFALGRMESAEDSQSLQRASQAFEASDLDLRELMVALTQTNGFVFRGVAPGEVVP